MHAGGKRTRAPLLPLAASAIGLVATLSMASTPVAHAEPASGFIRVRTVPSVAIELDGQPRGATAGNEGLILRAVSPGAHRLRAALSGHVDQLRAVWVDAGEIVTVRLRPWLPVGERATDSTPEAKAPMGSLWVEALEGDATLDAKPLGWKKIALEGEPFVAPSIPAGKHKLTFCNSEKCLDFSVLISARETLALLVDFGSPAIHDVTVPKRSAWARWQKECEAGTSRLACERACNAELALTLGARSAACELLERASGGPTLAAAPGMSAPAAPAPSPVASETLEPPCIPLGGGRRGQVTLRSSPSADVYLGAKRLGATPLTGIEVPAGCVEFRVVVPGRSPDKRLVVEVEPDQLTVYDFQP